MSGGFVGLCLERCLVGRNRRQGRSKTNWAQYLPDDLKGISRPRGVHGNLRFAVGSKYGVVGDGELGEREVESGDCRNGGLFHGQVGLGGRGEATATTRGKRWQERQKKRGGGGIGRQPY